MRLKMLGHRAALVAAFLFAATLNAAPAWAQLALCPKAGAKLIPGLSYTITANDACSWLVFTGAGPLAVTLPAPSLTVDNSFTATLVPISPSAAMTLTPSQNLVTGTTPLINDQRSLSLNEGSSAQVKVGNDGNWYVSASGGSGGAGANVILVGGDATSCLLVGGDATSCMLAN